MALVTIHRSPSVTSTPSSSEHGSSEYFSEDIHPNKSLSEYYFAVKGFAVLLPKKECQQVRHRKSSVPPADIQSHLQAILHLLRPGDTLQMAVRLESMHTGRTRYLAVVSTVGRNHDNDESCMLGVDFTEPFHDENEDDGDVIWNMPTIGLALAVLADTNINLDGDGGFSVSSAGRKHIFKPISVQAMWSALQTVSKESVKASENNLYTGGVNHDWVGFYAKNISSDQSRVNEWNAMEGIESKRPPSPDSLTNKEETEMRIRNKLKEIMMSVNIDEVTSKFIRQRLEDELDLDLFNLKSFIDREMLIILGQMDSATEIFPHVFLGSEWNASNLEELKRNGIGYILNVTREIDNFFPGRFDYLNVRVYDDENTELLRHWDHTYRYIARAKEKGSKVLVHCKMGISRSASVVIAYAMKANGMSLAGATDFVRKKRSCIKPNQAFVSQLKIYQGILDASRQRHNILFRSKSETNLKRIDAPGFTYNQGFCYTPGYSYSVSCSVSGTLPKQSSSPSSVESDSSSTGFCYSLSPQPKSNCSLLKSRSLRRPRSWSPSDVHCAGFPLFYEQTNDFDALRKSFSLNEKTWEARVTLVQHHLKDPGKVAKEGLVEAINPLYLKSQEQRILKVPSAVKEKVSEFEHAPLGSLGVDLNDGKSKNVNSDADPTSDSSNYWSSTVYVSSVKESSDTNIYSKSAVGCNQNQGINQSSQEYSKFQRSISSIEHSKFYRNNSSLPSAQNTWPIPDSKLTGHMTTEVSEVSKCQSSRVLLPAGSGKFENVGITMRPMSNSRRLRQDELIDRRKSSPASSKCRFSCDLLNVKPNNESQSTPTTPSEDVKVFPLQPASPQNKGETNKFRSSPQTPEHEIPLPGTVKHQMAKLERYLKQMPGSKRCCLPASPIGRSLSSGCVCSPKTGSGSDKKKSGITRSCSEKRTKTANELERGTVKSLTLALESTRCFQEKSQSPLKRNSQSLKQKSRRSKLPYTAGFHRSQSLEQVGNALARNPSFTSSLANSLKAGTASSQEILSSLVERTEAQIQQLEQDQRQNEINVKNLVGLFEEDRVPNCTLASPVHRAHSLRNPKKKTNKLHSSHRHATRPRSEYIGEAILPPVPLRKSSLDYAYNPNSKSQQELSGNAQKNHPTPLFPTMVNGKRSQSFNTQNSVSTNQANLNPCSSQVRLKKQQGKTHPLSKLTPRQNLL